MDTSEVKPIQLVIFNDASVLLSMLQRIIVQLKEQTGVTDSGVIYHASIKDLYTTSLWDAEQIIVFMEPDKESLKELEKYSQEPSWDRIVVIATTKPQALFRKKLPTDKVQVHEPKTSRASDIIAPLLAYLNLDQGAKMTILDTVGESVDQIPSLVDTLLAIYGTEKRLTREDVTPWLTPGTVPIWGLTDAIDRGNVPQALNIVDRIWESSSPIGIVSALRTHMERIYLMYCTGITSETQAGKFLGMKNSNYPAKKAIQSARQYGESSGNILKLILDADIACRGGRGSGVPKRLIIEILVARMCAYPRG